MVRGVALELGRRPVGGAGVVRRRFDGRVGGRGGRWRFSGWFWMCGALALAALALAAVGVLASARGGGAGRGLLGAWAWRRCRWGRGDRCRVR
jgi:hypothetical protein